MRHALVLLAFVASLHAMAQGIERVFVETYAVTPRPDGAPLTTYRIYVDLAPGQQLQMVYGDEHHPLWIRTTTTFFNDTTNGEAFADRINADRLGRFPLALDSWLSLGAASSAHIGVPLADDHDGSVLECPPYAGANGLDGVQHTPICVADGLQRDSTLKEVTPFNFTPGCLGRSDCAEVATNNGAWAVLGGVKSATEANMFLVAQLSTTGTLSFQLNFQVAGPDRKPVKYVASDAAEGEVLFTGSSFGL